MKNNFFFKKKSIFFDIDHIVIMSFEKKDGQQEIAKVPVDLRVLGPPNPGQSFGRGLSGPQATEVSMDPHGSWAATNLTVHSPNSFLGPSFWQLALRSYS